MKINETAFKKILAVIFLLLLFVVQGCAKGGRFPANEALNSARVEAVRIGGDKYVAASVFSGIYQLRRDYDVVSQRLLLKKNGHTAVLRPDAEVLLIDGGAVYTDKAAILYRGSLFIPLSLIEERLDRLFNRGFGRLPGGDEGRNRIRKIVIDAGHGGKDPGAVGRYGLKEKDVALDVSRRVKRMLEERGIEVVMTRDTDRYISLWQRTSISNKNSPDFFISIHANAHRNRRPSGFEVFYLSDALDDSARAVQAVENAVWETECDFSVKPTKNAEAAVWDMLYDEYRLESREMAKCMCDSMQADGIGKNRGVKSARFYVLKGVQSPSVLVEMAFISNKREEAMLKQVSYRQRVADALVKGILNYKERYEETDGFTR